MHFKYVFQLLISCTTPSLLGLKLEKSTYFQEMKQCESNGLNQYVEQAGTRTGPPPCAEICLMMSLPRLLSKLRIKHYISRRPAYHIFNRLVMAK